MIRPSIKELCGLDANTLIGLPHEVATKKIIDALQVRKEELAKELRQVHLDKDYGYEYVSAINQKLLYVNKAIDARTKDFNEINFTGQITFPETKKGQSKKHSHYEATTNQVIGVMMGWSIVYFIFPLLKHLTAFELATVSSIMFFISSYSRTYSLRRLFNALSHTDIPTLLQKIKWRRS